MTDRTPEEIAAKLTAGQPQYKWIRRLARGPAVTKRFHGPTLALSGKGLVSIRRGIECDVASITPLGRAVAALLATPVQQEGGSDG